MATDTPLDLVGPSPDTADDALVRWAGDFASDVLLPGAARVDSDGLDRSVLTSMGPLLALAAPSDGAVTTPSQWREISELIMAADGTTWFCWSQHHPLVRTIGMALPYAGEHAASLVALRDDLVHGRKVGAISFSHVRRPGPATLTAQRVEGGWRIDGRVDWVTAWDVADVVLVLAESEGSLVHLAVDTAPQPGLLVEAPLRLMAMSGSHTRPVSFDGVVVPDGRLVGVMPKQAWLAIDDKITAQPNPAAFGLARGAIAHLAQAAQRRECARTQALAEDLAAQTRSLRERSYAAIDSGEVEGLLELRALGLDLAVRASAAAMTASGGHALMSGNDAERRYREAAFLLVQRQTTATRLASLDTWLRPESTPSAGPQAR